MANDNKKIHDLVSESDEDTSELEILPDTIAADPDYDYESESDAATHAFESLNRKHDSSSVATLQSELRDRDDGINRLHFDLEQLRARSTGLETELKAREELTKNVTTELTRTNQELTEAQSLLKIQESKIAALEATVGQQTEQRSDADRTLTQARNDAAVLQSDIDDLKIQNSEAMNRIDSLIGDVNYEKSERKRTQAAEQSLGRAFRELGERQTKSQSVIESLRHYIEGRKDRWDRQEAELRAKDELLDNQRKKIGEFTKDIKRDTKRLRKEQAARQNFQTQNEILQKDNAQLQSEVAELKSLVADVEKSARIAQEQAGSLATRLDETVKELEEEQFDRRSLASELKERQDEAASLHEEISNLKETAHGNEVLLELRQQEFDELSRQIEHTGKRLADEESTRQALESQLAGLQNEVTQLRHDNGSLKTSAINHQEVISQQLSEIGNLSAQLSDTRNKLENDQSDRQILEAQHAALQGRMEQLNSEVAALKIAAAYKTSLKKEHAELSGLVASNKATIKELNLRISKNEAYADTLRMKLQKQLSDSESLAAGRQNVQASLKDALEQIDKLTLQLHAERNSNAELAEVHQQNQKNFAEEIRKIRFELDAAQDTVAETQTINEQLASDLLDNTGFRRTLETQLIESDEDRKKEMKELDNQLEQSKKRTDELERKVANKDAAINALLTELAHKPHVIVPENEADSVVHKLVNKKSQVADERTGHEKDRVTRLLIGNIDGQELRFPLFKDKLTIGRTAHNDIQLKAQYISRRHAVVVTDDECTRIVDWGSKNGIYVNGTRATEKILKNGDRITVGTAQFKFEERPKR